MPSLDQYIAQVKSLPPAPRILPQLLELLGVENVPTERIVELVTFDPALTARVLHRCNAAAFGSDRAVHDLSEAVPRLGYNEVYRLVAAVVGESVLGGSQPGYGIGTGELWQHSVAAAVAARQLAQRRDADENLVFTAALLHDVGKLVLSGYLADSYASIVTQTENSGRSLQEVEQSLLGTDHAEVGAKLLEQWHFPDKLVLAVRHHHDPIQARPFEQLAAYVYTGDIIAHLVGHGHGHQAYALRVRGEILDWLKLDPKHIESCVLETGMALGEIPWFSPAKAL